MRVGIIGTGVMGADHARTLRDAVTGATVEAVSDADRSQAASVGVRVVNDPIALIKDPDIDAVLIASSDATHEEFVLACLAAGKPALCEKPLAPDVAGCQRIVAAEAQLGRRLISVGFMRRYDPGYGALKRTLDAGDLGAPLLLHCVHRNVSAPDWFAGDMVITNSAGHEIDITRWLFGEIASVTVHRPRASAALADPVLLVFETISGVVVDAEVFVNAGYGYDVHCELVGQHGRATASGPVTADWRDRFADAYRLELTDWVEGVRAGEARGASAWDGYVASAVARACVSAPATGRVAVEVPPKPVLYK
ncbi:MAG TPA: Gfo/Idh/MocA family oxidoreductase [Jatrophihabitantaceae bacterium]